MWLIIKHPRCLLLCVLLILVRVSGAQSVIVSEQAKVQNDTMEVLFVAKVLSGSPEAAMSDVMTLADWALSYQSSYPEVAILQATPQRAQYYDSKKRLQEWSASQEIKLKSENLEEIHALTGELLGRLDPVRVQFLLSERERAKTERILLAKVLQRYEDKSVSLSVKPQHYIRITANNLANETSRSLSKTLLEARSLDASFQPGFSIIKVELVGI